MNLNKTSAVITAGGLILTALPVVGVSAASAAPVSASQVTQTQLQPRAAKSSVTVSSKRVSGNRVRVVAKTKAKKISVKYRAGKMLKTSKRVSRGKAAVILPSRTTRISVRVVGSPWRAVSVPRFTGGATGGGNNAGGAGGAGSGNRGNAQDPAFAEDTWTDHLPPVFGGPPGMSER